MRQGISQLITFGCIVICIYQLWDNGIQGINWLYIPAMLISGYFFYDSIKTEIKNDSN